MAKKRSKKSPAKKPARKLKTQPVKKPAASKADGNSYARHRARMRDEQQKKSTAGRDIGALPAVEKPRRRAACRKSFRKFCETYFPETFYLGWSKDHLTVIAGVERSVKSGGLQAIAMPRGSGKSSLCEAACLWSLLYGLRSFVALIGADEGHAREALVSILSELEGNELLLADFPEFCKPISELEGIRQRRLLCEGQPVKMRFAADEIQLPWITGTAAQGGVLRVAGITGRIRGMKAKLPDGRSIRPDLAVVDDPQTDESAASPSQCATREKVIAGAVLGLAGPKCRIAGLMPCTVVREGDMADRVLDRETHPEWNGVRTKLVYEFPTDEKLWDEYAQLRAEGMRQGDDGAAATEFYRQNRKAMDAGAKVAWPERFNDDEISAIQNAMNLKIQDRYAFFAEYQNEPIDPDESPEMTTLKHADIAGKINGLPRGAVMDGCQVVTAFMDIQQNSLWWVVAAWKPDFTGQVLDYGVWPDQRRHYFTMREITKTLARVAPGAGVEGAIHNGLVKLSADLFGRQWTREDGADMRLRLMLIDANWNQSTSIVRDFCRRSKHGAAVMPAHGKGIGVSKRPMSEYATKRGEALGHHWKTSVIARQAHVLTDVNYWKSFLYERLAVPFGDPGSLTLFGSEPNHRMFADHLLAETRVRAQDKDSGRMVDEWRQRSEKPDNHWFDCLVGCAVAASMLGCNLNSWQGETGKRKSKRRRRKVRYGN